MSDLELDRSYRKGDNGPKVRLIQEWLCLHGYNVVIDGDFGPASDSAVRAFQQSTGLTIDGIVEEGTFGQLVLPMMNALRAISGAGKKLGDEVVSYAEQHLAEHPREIGGQNRGPWVRLYMDGNEGPSWPWCAGFASFVLKQACASLNLPLPIKTSFSCDLLAASGQEKGKFLAEAQITDKKQITPGSLFFVRRTTSDWEHTGIVLSAESDVFHTIEGNTNDEGSREGYEVCKRFRGYKDKDFIVL